MKKTIEITKEQAVELLKTTPSLTDIIYSNFPELKPKKRWFEEYEMQKYFLIKKADSLFYVNNTPVNTLSELSFKTQQQAEQHAKRLNLYTEMQVFANFRNGDWVADWNDSEQEKYGIDFYEGELRLDHYTLISSFIFNVSVKSEEIAQEMLEEFGDRIKECFNFK